MALKELHSQEITISEFAVRPKLFQNRLALSTRLEYPATVWAHKLLLRDKEKAAPSWILLFTFLKSRGP